jgi:hypothetical protein
MLASCHPAAIVITALLIVCSVSGCAAQHGGGNASTRTLFSRQANPQAALTQCWNEWGDTHLQNGDIVFMRGDCYMVLGTVNFSDVSTDLTASRFSHIGLVAIEDGQAYVYDIRNEGTLRTRFGELVAHRHLHQLAVKRHQDASPEELAQVAQSCRDVFQRREKYDSDLLLNNDRLYCTELVEQAYQTVGYTLSEPIAIQDLPNYDRHQSTIRFVQAVTRIEPEQQVLVPGNDQFGIWSNPALKLILDLPNTRQTPTEIETLMNP